MGTLLISKEFQWAMKYFQSLSNYQLMQVS